jgi:hypothetical protein
VLAGLALTACSHPRGALAGFKGKLTLHTVEAGGRESDYVVTAKGDQLRIDVPPPATQPSKPEVTLGHAVYEHSMSNVRIFFDTTKEYRDLDLSKRIAAERPGPEVGTIAPTGAHKVVAGLACDEWSVKAPDGGRTDVCLAQGLAFLEIFRVQFGPKKTESLLARELREHSTFPLERIELDPTGKEVARMEVTKVERVKVDDDAFTVPAGYAKVDPHFDTPPPGGPNGGTSPKHREHQPVAK